MEIACRGKNFDFGRVFGLAAKTCSYLRTLDHAQGQETIPQWLRGVEIVDTAQRHLEGTGASSPHPFL